MLKPNLKPNKSHTTLTPTTTQLVNVDKLYKKVLQHGGAELLAHIQDINLLPSPAKVAAKEFITQDPATIHTLTVATQLAEYDEPVLITGESGVGKEIIASIVGANRCSKNLKEKRGNFVAINCAALNESILESELFGHERGAFTGADTVRAGLFESAQNGIIFLDEIADAPLQLQAKLLRVLQTKRIRRVGSNSEITINFRIIAATHKSLPDLVRQQLFREDLFWRLFGYNIHITPLRERPGDIPEILDHYFSAVPQEFIDEVTTLELRGNVRELLAQYRHWQFNNKLFTL